MAAFIVQLRKANPLIRYSQQIDAVREKFQCARRTAEHAATVARENIHQDFLKFAADAPRTIFDAYMDLHAEAVREKNWNSARKTLDSVRDMFGIKTPVQVFIGAGPPPSAYANLTDAQLDALATLDQAVPAAMQNGHSNGHALLAVPPLDIIDAASAEVDEREAEDDE